MKRADPGIGNEAAPVGTVAWAQNMRLAMQHALHHVHITPESFSRYVTFAIEHRAWTLMNKPDGSTFATFAAFCEHAEPYGLGKPVVEVEKILKFAIGDKAAALGIVAPAQSPPGKAPIDKAHDGPLPSGTNDKRLRAVATRTPEPVRDLFKADLIGIVEAAKLGPKNPTPDEAAHVTEIAQTLATEAKALPQSTPAEKATAKRTITKRARELLGEPAADPVARVLRAISKLSTADRARLFAALTPS